MNYKYRYAAGADPEFESGGGANWTMRRREVETPKASTECGEWVSLPTGGGVYGGGYALSQKIFVFFISNLHVSMAF